MKKYLYYLLGVIMNRHTGLIRIPKQKIKSVISCIIEEVKKYSEKQNIVFFDHNNYEFDMITDEKEEILESYYSLFAKRFFFFNDIKKKEHNTIISVHLSTFETYQGLCSENEIHLFIPVDAEFEYNKLSKNLYYTLSHEVTHLFDPYLGKTEGKVFETARKEYGKIINDPLEIKAIMREVWIDMSISSHGKILDDILNMNPYYMMYDTSDIFRRWQPYMTTKTERKFMNMAASFHEKLFQVKT